MKIVVTRFPYESAYGGEEYHTVTIGKYFESQGHEVSFFGSCPVLHLLFINENLKSHKCNFIKAPVTPLQLVLFIATLPILWPYSIFRYITACKNVDVLYALSLPDKLLLTPIALLSGTKVMWLEHQMLGNWLLKSPLRWWYSLLANKVRIVPISEYNTNILLNKLHVSSKNINNITHGIDVETFTVSNKEKNPNLCMYAGRLEPEKGVMTLLQGFSEIIKARPDSTLLLLGFGSLDQTIDKYITEHNLKENVTVMPALSYHEYVEQLQEATVLILPSNTHHETFGLVAAEAMACGTVPVVTSYCGIATTLKNSFPELVVEPNNAAALAKVILQGLNGTFTKADIRKHAVEYYNSERMLTDYAKLICTT